MKYKAKVAVCSETRTKHSAQSEHHVEFLNVKPVCGDRGSTVVMVLFYKSEGLWFDPSWCQWNFH